MILNFRCLYLLIKINITIQGSGIIRPINEKTEVKVLTSEIIEEVYVNEYERIEKDQPILKLRDDKIIYKIKYFETEYKKIIRYIEDLKA